MHADTKVRVMLVDDSATIRGLLTRVFEEEPAIEIVGSFMNGEIAVNKVGKIKPDIIILDVEMPVMDGLTALPKILRESPSSKVIMFSTLTERGAAVSLKALSLGAVECLVKPSTNMQQDEFKHLLIGTVMGLARPSNDMPPPAVSQEKATPAATPQTAPTAIPLRKDEQPHTKPEVLLIGSSTGGPQALFTVLKALGSADMPILITQHMPAKFTTLLAGQISNQTTIEAIEGEQDMIIENGKAYVAPGGFHMTFKRGDDSLVRIDLLDTPPVNYCKPAVDPMFESAAEIYKGKALGVILTGMGSDGLHGSRKLIETGGRLIAQDQASSVVWGMPKAVAEDGLCSAVLPLDEIGGWLKKAVS